MVGPVINVKVRKFLMTLFKKGGHISYGIASTTANVLLSRSEDLSLKNIKTTLKSVLLLVALQWHQKVQLVLVWLEVPTSVALY